MKLWLAVFCFAVAHSIGALFLAVDSPKTDDGNELSITPPLTIRYAIDANRSTFMVHAFRGGLAWFKGHDHLIAARDFSGIAELTPGDLNPAKLQMKVKADSLEETSDDFTPQQKGIINNELKEIVLESAKYSDITFVSTDVKGGLKNGEFEIKIGGDMTLLGVTRHIEIPATVSLEGDSLRAKGEFKLDRSNFNVKATSAFHGWVRIKNGLRFSFDIVGKKLS